MLVRYFDGWTQEAWVEHSGDGYFCPVDFLILTEEEQQ